METTGTLIGKYAPDFELPGTDGTVHHLARYLETLKAVGVVFMCNHCPFVRSYLERLKQIQTDFQHQSFTLIGINTNDAEQVPEDSFENMKLFAAEQQLNFPYLRDVTQDVARCFKATKTPEVFLIDHQSVIRYQGGIDDRVHEPEAVQNSYLRTTITQLLQGETIELTTTEAIGCSLKWRT